MAVSAGGYQRHSLPGFHQRGGRFSDLAGQFYDAGLLDEVIVQLGSVTLGRGKPLLPRQILSPCLSLVSAKRIGPGFADLRYEVVPAKAASAPGLQ